MGRDDHFVSRLDRFDDADAALALELFRHPWIVVAAIEHAAVGDESTRFALAMTEDPAGPRVISAFDGQFVTCLASAWANGPWPVIARAHIEHARRAYWSDLLRELSPTFDERWLSVVTAIEHSGAMLAPSLVETLRELCAIEPLIRQALVLRYLARWARGVSYIARRPEGLAVEPRVALDLWSAAWALVRLRAALDDHDRAALESLTPKQREWRRGEEVIEALDSARRAALALRGLVSQRHPHNRPCPCGSGRRARRCCDRSRSRVRIVDEDRAA
ncbi:MAG: hypothetical protein U0269_34510 [Polyangiales bacterium]